MDWISSEVSITVVCNCIQKIVVPIRGLPIFFGFCNESNAGFTRLSNSPNIYKLLPK